MSHIGGSRAEGAAGERLGWWWCDRAVAGNFMQSIGLLFTAVVISRAILAPPRILRKHFVTLFYRQAARMVRNCSSLPTSPSCLLGCLITADRHRPCFLLVNPGMDVSCCLGKVGQVAILERGRLAPNIAILVDAAEGRVVEIAGLAVVGPTSGAKRYRSGFCTQVSWCFLT